MEKTGKKSVFKRGVCFLLAVLTVMSVFTGTAFAAGNVCASAKGDSAGNVTLQVTTGGSRWSAKPYITLNQTKGTMKIYVLRLDGNDYKTNKDMNEYYLVTLYKLVKGKYQQQGQPIKWTGSSSKKITLDKNSTYQIKIEPYAVKYAQDFSWGPALNPYPYAVFTFKIWAPRGWVKNCTWKASSYARINSCKKI